MSKTLTATTDDGARTLTALVDEHGFVLGPDGAPLATGCPACSLRPQPGHFLCSTTDDTLIALEREGKVGRGFTEQEWRWYVGDWGLVK